MVRARKSPWIETDPDGIWRRAPDVRARKSPWIETGIIGRMFQTAQSGLVRARGLKPEGRDHKKEADVRARKSPWIETLLRFSIDS